MCLKIRKRLRKFGITVGIATLVNSVLSTILFLMVGIVFILLHTTSDTGRPWSLALGIVIIVLGIAISWTMNVVIFMMTKTFRTHSNILVHHHAHHHGHAKGHKPKLSLDSVVHDVKHLIDVGLVKIKDFEEILESDVVQDAKLAVDLVKTIAHHHDDDKTKEHHETKKKVVKKEEDKDE